MRLLKVAVSNEAPNLRDCMWAKPVAGGFFNLYLLDGGMWKPLELVNPGNLNTLNDDTVISNKDIYDAIGSYEGGGGASTKGGETKA